MASWCGTVCWPSAPRQECRARLVTMSWRRLADAVIAAAPSGSFAASVTGDEVSNGKPDPEPYLAAATALGVDPARCVAIEDSPTGVASAFAAGCATLGVPHVVPLTPAPGLTIVGSLADTCPRRSPRHRRLTPRSSGRRADGDPVEAGRDGWRAPSGAVATPSRRRQLLGLLVVAVAVGGVLVATREAPAASAEAGHPVSTPGRRTGRSTHRFRRPTVDSVRFARSHRSGSAPSA